MPGRNVLVALHLFLFLVQGGHCSTDPAHDDIALLQKARAAVGRGGLDGLADESGKDTVRMTANTTETIIKASTSRNLVVYFDGTWNGLETPCKYGGDDNIYPPGMDGPGRQCETNIAEMWRMSVNDGVTQLTYYERGVGSKHPEAGVTGSTLFEHTERGYRWLTENYQPGDKVYLYGFSRGTLSARQCQHWMHTTGLPKPAFYKEALALNTSDKAALHLWWNDAKDKHHTVDVEFVGLFESVVRTVFTLESFLPGDTLGITLTSSVKNLVHAIALDEAREIFQAQELMVNNATVAKQVWFPGEHGDVGGGWPTKGIRHLSLGWMCDESVKLGLRLNEGWETTLKMNALGETHERRNVILEGSQLWYTIRNPGYCRNETFGNKPILMHRSVKDRVELIHGYNSLAYCCDAYKDSLVSHGITYVTNDQYEANRDKFKHLPRWIRVKLGQLKNVPIPAQWSDAYDYVVQVQAWYEGAEVPSDKVLYPGCCGEWYATTDQNVLLTDARGSQDFTGKEVVIPLDRSVSNEVLIEISTSVLMGTHYVGRAIVKFDDVDKGVMKHHVVSYLGDSNGTIEASIEFIDDDSTKSLITDVEGDALVCKWLSRETGMYMDGYSWWAPGFYDLCNPAPSLRSCNSFIKDITWGR